MGDLCSNRHGDGSLPPRAPRRGVCGRGRRDGLPTEHPKWSEKDGDVVLLILFCLTLNGKTGKLL